MFNKNEFEHIREWIIDFEKKRDNIIGLSREIISLSKKIISFTMQNKISDAKDLVNEIEIKKNQLCKKNYNTNLPYVAEQEYVEALCFLNFVEKGVVPSMNEIKVDVTSYLAGLGDFTGELVRLAVNDVINGNYDRALKIKDFVAELHYEFTKLELRDSELRRKADSVRWNLKKLEDLALDIVKLKTK